MSLEIAGAFVYFTIPIFGGIPIKQTTVSSLIVTLILIIGSIKLGKRLKMRPDGVQVILEKGYGMMLDMVSESMGPHNLHWTPFITTIFLSSMLGSYIGLTGFLRSVTADLSCTLVWSVAVSCIIWYQNIKQNGLVNWLKGFTEPIFLMTPMNLLGEVAQPVAMAFRHFGNIAGGGVINSVIYLAFSMLSTAVLNAISASGPAISIVLLVVGAALIFLWKKKTHKLLHMILGALCAVLGLFGLMQALGLVSGIPILSFGIPAVLSCYFDIFSGFVQAYVFTLLTMVYIGNACPSPEESAEAAQ